MAHLELNDIVYFLPDGRQLLNGVGFRVGDGAKTALIGPNGTGKTTLTRIVAGDEAPDEGAVSSLRFARGDAAVRRAIARRLDGA